jgi:hypothetical protein
LQHGLPRLDAKHLEAKHIDAKTVGSILPTPSAANP